MALSFLMFVALVQVTQQAGTASTTQTPPTTATAPAPVTPASAALQPAPSALFAVAPAVAETHRIALTPKINGKMEDEEWDPFSTTGAVKSYFEWEPGVIYAAATGPAGQDLLVSLDLDADGWLVGDDNLEARVSTVNGKPQVTVRQLDATNISGPVWHDLPGFALASECATSADGANVTYELKLVDPGLDLLPKKGQKVNTRIDLIPSNDPQAEAFLPRVLAPVELVTMRAAALPSGLRWSVEHTNRSITPGDSGFLRVTFNAKPPVPLKKLELRSEGEARDATNQLTVPFPVWDEKGRAYVDYNTRVDAKTDIGYRILRGSLTAGDGTTAILEASYRLAPPADFDLVEKPLKADSKDRSVVFGYYLSSNTDRVVDGTVEMTVPAPLRLVNGEAVQKYRVPDNRGRLRNTFELFIPGGSPGTYPLTFKVTANGDTRTYVRFVTVG